MKTIKRNFTGFLKTSLGLAAIFLFFTAAGQDQNLSFDDWDSNNNDVISRSEFVNNFTNGFADKWRAETNTVAYNENKEDNEGIFNDDNEVNDSDGGILEDNDNGGVFDDDDEVMDNNRDDDDVFDTDNEAINDNDDEGLFDNDDAVESEKYDDGILDDDEKDDGLFDDDETNDNEGLFDDNDFYESTYDVWDTNDDDLLSEDEWNYGYDYSYGNYIYDDYETIDQNRNGSIDYDEYQNTLGKSTYYSDWDMNKDNKLNNQELARMVFNNWDYDNSNFIENDEFQDLKDYYLMF